MAAITTRHGPKAFAWSYSRLKNFEACPAKHYAVDLTKSFKEEESDQLLWGNQVHDAMAKACSDKRIPLPKAMQKYQPWVDRVVTTPGNVYVENKLALTREFGACTYFADDVWFRSIADVIKINGDVAWVPDWKTGKVVVDSVQLALSAACVFAKYPNLKKICTEFAWLKENCSTTEFFTPADMPGMWRALWPRIQALEHAHNTTTYQAKQSGLCKNYCPVRSCVHNGGYQG